MYHTSKSVYFPLSVTLHTNKLISYLFIHTNTLFIYPCIFTLYLSHHFHFLCPHALYPTQLTLFAIRVYFYIHISMSESCGSVTLLAFESYIYTFTRERSKPRFDFARLVLRRHFFSDLNILQLFSFYNLILIIKRKLKFSSR